MVTLSKSPPDNVKKVHCPICGGRLCDVKEDERICLDNGNKSKSGIIVKCYKCGNKINISVQ